ncbi:hypothetical protein D1872_340380 [compost metagenome]
MSILLHQVAALAKIGGLQQAFVGELAQGFGQHMAVGDVPALGGEEGGLKALAGRCLEIIAGADREQRLLD